MALGDNIRKRRLELKLSQQALADALGYKTRSSIAKIENNSTSLSHDRLVSLSNTLHTTVEYLLTGHISASGAQKSSVVSNAVLREAKPVADKIRCTAVILAGGRRRINKYSIPIQFVTVKNKPVILYTMDAFQRHPLVDEIHVVCLEGWEDFLPAYAEKYGITKLKEIIPAGDSGIKSVKNAVEWLSPSHSPYDMMIIHEATRPFVDPETITNAIRCCKQFGSGVTFERMDCLTPFFLGDGENSLAHLNANKLINVQSPEVYSFGALRQAFFEAANAHLPLDETICSVFLYHLGRELKFCEGNHNNLRIVYEEDLRLMESLVR